MHLSSHLDDDAKWSIASLVSCTGARPFPSTNDALSVTLVGFDLDYIWKIRNNVPAEKTGFQAAAKLNPFSRSVLSLPYLTAVNSVIERFVVFQLVKRYPLIFGPWCQGTSTICIPEDVGDAVLLEHEVDDKNEIDFVSSLSSSGILESYSEQYNFDSDGGYSYRESMHQKSSEHTWPHFEFALAPPVFSSEEKRMNEDGIEDDRHLNSRTEDNDNDSELRDRLGSQYTFRWYKNYATSAELDLGDADISSSYCDWSGDDEDEVEGSQEKLNFASMGIPLASNTDNLQPHNLPRSRLARIDEIRLDHVCLVSRGHQGSRAWLSQIQKEDANANHGNCLFADVDVDMEQFACGANFDTKAKDNGKSVEARSAALHLDYDFGPNYIPLDYEGSPPHAVALSLGKNNSTITLGSQERVPTTISLSAESDSSFSTQQELVDRTCEQEGFRKAPSDNGFFAIEFD
ncbi:hypothetical protein JR316_0007173 [Psilocybe cubensis]|uniref:Uncharacterized protein n=2 Tax=Psilocybe cubensis TaxID=181762 RepID=A0A8H7XR61_PSICU|nr:hypothetical protein JR316_0007173 [Psilocybe cubensis]KAH9480573.1 hypothetical protein JR316_0007173 [Psilocybe cubensis]